MSESLHDVLVFEVTLLSECLDAKMLGCHMVACMVACIHGLQVLPPNGYKTVF
jgi:hypothetical protein